MRSDDSQTGYSSDAHETYTHSPAFHNVRITDDQGNEAERIRSPPLNREPACPTSSRRGFVWSELFLNRYGRGLNDRVRARLIAIGIVWLGPFLQPLFSLGDKLNRTLKVVSALCVLFLGGSLLAAGQDLPNSKDPAGMKRYEGSELIGYRAPMFDEYLLPLGPPSSFSPASL